jgi:hypothetical protein
MAQTRDSPARPGAAVDALEPVDKRLRQAVQLISADDDAVLPSRQGLLEPRSKLGQFSKQRLHLLTPGGGQPDPAAPVVAQQVGQQPGVFPDLAFFQPLSPLAGGRPQVIIRGNVLKHAPGRDCLLDRRAGLLHCQHRVGESTLSRGYRDEHGDASVALLDRRATDLVKIFACDVRVVRKITTHSRQPRLAH